MLSKETKKDKDDIFNSLLACWFNYLIGIIKLVIEKTRKEHNGE